MPKVRKAVTDSWVRYNEPLESYLDFIYLDVLGLCTTGCGNLIDPLHYALILPWRLRGTSRPATAAEVRAAWNLVKSRQDMAPHGGARFGSLPGNNVYLARADIEELVRGKLQENVAKAVSRFSAFPSWPADAQLALLSRYWAAGAASPYPKMDAALKASPPAFDVAAKESALKGNPKRSALQRALLEAAARVQAEGLDPEVLHAPPPT
jgi:hypothetical protein